MAAKDAAKEYKVKLADILSNITPNAGISGSRSWDTNGKIIKL